jgi:hypothetical protein
MRRRRPTAPTPAAHSRGPSPARAICRSRHAVLRLVPAGREAPHVSVDRRVEPASTPISHNHPLCILVDQPVPHTAARHHEPSALGAIHTRRVATSTRFPRAAASSGTREARLPRAARPARVAPRAAQQNTRGRTSGDHEDGPVTGSSKLTWTTRTTHSQCITPRGPSVFGFIGFEIREKSVREGPGEPPVGSPGLCVRGRVAHGGRDASSSGRVAHESIRRAATALAPVCTATSL